MVNVKKIILTGHSGYLGRNILKELKRNRFEVLTIGRKKSDIIVNLKDKIKIQNFLNPLCESHTLIHCAGFVPKNEKQYDSIQNKKNIEIFKNILSTNINSIIFISSFSVYGDRKKASEVMMNPVKSMNIYARSKIICENLAFRSSKKVLILRVPGVFGGDKKKGLIFNCIKTLKEKKNFLIQKKYPLWTTIHIKDVALGIVEILKRGIKKTEIINLSYSKSPSIEKTLTIIFNLFKIKLDLLNDNTFIFKNKNRFKKIKNFKLRIKEEIKLIK
jgi:2-alkyl-3-oxoalkanoate reductase